MKKLFNIKTIIFTILIILLMLLVPKIYGLIMLLFAAFIIAAALNPYVNKLQEKLKSRAFASTVIVLTSIVAVIALFIPIIIMCWKELHMLVLIIPQKIVNLNAFINNFSLYGYNFSDLTPSLDSIVGASTDFAQGFFSQSISFTIALFQTVFIMVALTMFVFYILLDKQYLRDKFIEFFPPQIKGKAGAIVSDITYQVGNYVRAQIVSMAAVGAMIAIALAILGIEYPVLLGLIAGVCDIIPVIGPTVALAIIIAIAFPAGLVKVILAVVLFLAAQQVSNYVIRPFLFGKFMKLHPITILVALFIAQEFLGIWGVIISPAIAATICVLIDELYLNPINAKENTYIE
ncbi:AI-2E family transporter [bacterium]|nr:AI-2E family transporter [bacterium]